MKPTDEQNREFYADLKRAEIGVDVADYARTLRELGADELRVHALISCQQVLELHQALERAERRAFNLERNLNILLNSTKIEEIW